MWKRSNRKKGRENYNDIQGGRQETAGGGDLPLGSLMSFLTEDIPLGGDDDDDCM